RIGLEHADVDRRRAHVVARGALEDAEVVAERLERAQRHVVVLMGDADRPAGRRAVEAALQAQLTAGEARGRERQRAAAADERRGVRAVLAGRTRVALLRSRALERRGRGACRAGGARRARVALRTRRADLLQVLLHGGRELVRRDRVVLDVTALDRAVLDLG